MLIISVLPVVNCETMVGENKVSNKPTTTQKMVDHNPVIGSEQGGIRPVLIISNNIGNKHSPTVIVAAITSRAHTKSRLPTHKNINEFSGLTQNSVVLLEQIRTIDKQRLQMFLGTLDRRFMVSVDDALSISLALEGRKKSA